MRFPLLVKDPKRMTAFFAGFGVELGRWFEYPISPPPSPGAYGYDPGDCPVGEEVGRHMVNLPSHTRMSERDIETTITALDEYFSTHPDEAVFATEWNRA
jgi:dTDP-4-amino-4,6-dideoxygalactose transaminase